MELKGDFSDLLGLSRCLQFTSLGWVNICRWISETTFLSPQVEAECFFIIIIPRCVLGIAVVWPASKLAQVIYGLEPVKVPDMNQVYWRFVSTVRFGGNSHVHALKNGPGATNTANLSIF